MVRRADILEGRTVGAAMGLPLTALQLNSDGQPGETNARSTSAGRDGRRR